MRDLIYWLLLFYSKLIVWCWLIQQAKSVSVQWRQFHMAGRGPELSVTVWACHNPGLSLVTCHVSSPLIGQLGPRLVILAGWSGCNNFYDLWQCHGQLWSPHISHVEWSLPMTPGMIFVCRSNYLWIISTPGQHQPPDAASDRGNDSYGGCLWWLISLLHNPGMMSAVWHRVHHKYWLSPRVGGLDIGQL